MRMKRFPSRCRTRVGTRTRSQKRPGVRFEPGPHDVGLCARADTEPLVPRPLCSEPVIGAATGSEKIELGSRAPVRGDLSHDPVQRVGGDTPRVIGITHVVRERVAQHQRDNALRMGRGER